LLDDDGNLVRPIMDGRFRLCGSPYPGRIPHSAGHLRACRDLRVRRPSGQ
jgi:hypothetical protein